MFVRIALAVVVLCVVTRVSRAVPVQWKVADGGNGHFYDSISGSKNWPQAKAAAESMSYLGVSGHLATTTSQEEFDFLHANFAPGSRWLGGYQDTGALDYSEPGGGWRWVTGEPFAFTAWHVGEPNNESGDENILEWHSDGSGWNDLDVRDVRPAYFVEFAVPEPSAVILLLLGGVVLACRWRMEIWN